MPLACIADTVHVYSVTKCLNEQRKEGQFCDVLLKVAGRTLPTHACVLSAVSPFFRGLIYGERPDTPHLTNAPQEIDLVMPGSEEWPPEDGSGGRGLEVVMALLDYIYTGKISLREGTLDLVVKLAEAFALEGLLAVVRRYAENVDRNSADKAADARSSAAKAEKKLPRAKQVVTLSIRRDRQVFQLPPKPPPVVQQSPPELPRPSVVLKKQQQQRPTVAVKSPMIRRRRFGGGVTSAKKIKSTAAGRADGTRAAAAARRARNQLHKKHKYWFSCTQCKFFSCDVKAVRDHKLVHPGKSYVCVSCGFFTVQCGKLLEHMLNANHPETECSLCGTECPDRISFRKHLERHDPRKPFLCNLCDFKCTSRSYLAAHTRKHTTERPFVCEVCMAAFKWKKSLQTHMLSHTKEKAFMCDQCDFRTAYKGTLKLHLRRHNGEMFKCPQEGCNCEAYSKQNLKKHMLTHSKEKPYVCEVCGQKYSQEQSLRRHLKVHEPGTGNRLHCRHCNFSTTRGYKLKEHARKVHHIDPPYGRSGVPYPPIAVERFGRSSIAPTADEVARQQQQQQQSSLESRIDRHQQLHHHRRASEALLAAANNKAELTPPPQSRHRRHEDEHVEQEELPGDDDHLRHPASSPSRDDLHENMSGYVGLGLGLQMSLPMFGGYH